jgi:hypothetical protein
VTVTTNTVTSGNTSYTGGYGLGTAEVPLHLTKGEHKVSINSLLGSR